MNGKSASSFFSLLPMVLMAAFLILPACNDQPEGDDDDSTEGSHAHPSLGLDSLELSFGQVDLGDHGDLTLTASNQGDADLNIDAQVTENADGQFSLESDAQQLVPSGESVAIIVRFAPSLEGESNGTLELISNDENNPITEISLNGTGVNSDPDEDGDGFSASMDCDDADPTVYPDATEICDTIDNNCNSQIDEGLGSSFYLDADFDGYGSLDSVVEACEIPEGYVENGDDCDDQDASIYPGAEELCDGLDNDCDGLVDEDVLEPLSWYPDADQDGFGTEEGSIQGCEALEGYVLTSGDCDDARADVYPEAPELCDGLDNDCDGEVDEEPVDPTTWYLDEDGDGYGVEDSTLEACEQPEGYAAVAGDCDDQHPAYHPGADESNCTDPNDYNCDGATGFVDGDLDGVPACSDCDDANPYASSSDAEETCDGFDNNCNELVDEGATIEFWIDADEDGHGSESSSVQVCEIPEGYSTSSDDCDDANSATYPGADEVCDTVDNDCDLEVDEDAIDPSTWYYDGDSDGYGTEDETVMACSAPDSYVAASGDCDDTDSSFHPDAEESDCTDPNDYNCDGSVGYIDDDLDGYAACEDCDDSSASIHPEASEVCNGSDDNCDLVVDEDGSEECTVVYADNDGDSWGGDDSACKCSMELGYSTRGGDCDDSDPKVSPDGNESCNGIDDDCNGKVDEENADGCERFYADVDQDDWGSNSDYACVCEAGDVYSAVTSGDCDDNDAEKYPGNLETCDGKDNNCSGEVDEGAKTTFYLDNDADGFGASYNSKEACEQPEGYSSQGGDCNDFNAEINPSAPELCDNVDNNCNGYSDEGLDEVPVYVDLDGDGHGAAGTSGSSSCLYDEDGDGQGESPPDGYSLEADDCDDSAAVVYPGAPELCDGRLNDCDAEVADYQCPSVCEGEWPVYVGVTSGYVTSGQFDGDNTYEVVVQGGGYSRMLESDGSEKWLISAGVQYSHPMVADMNLDGYMDVVLSENSAVRVASGVDGSILESYSVTNSGWRPGLVFDLDNDGITDIVGTASTYLSVILRDGAGGAKETLTLSPPEGSYFSGDVAGTTDVDGDGFAEIVVGTGYFTCGESGTPDCMAYLAIYDVLTGELKYDPTVDFVVPDAETAYAGGTWPFFADLDTDGEMELYHAFGNKVSGTSYLSWNPDGSSATPTHSISSGSPRVAPIDEDGYLASDGSLRQVSGGVADLEGDGIWEVIRMTSDGLAVFKGDEVMDGYPISEAGNQPLITDLDRDGRLDILFIGSEDASLHCYTLGEDTYASSRVLGNGSMDAYASGIYRTGGYDPFEPNDIANTPFEPETSTDPIVDSRAMSMRGFLDTYSSANGWSRSVTGLLGHQGDRDFFYATGSQIRVGLKTLVGDADYDVFLHMYDGSSGSYEYITTWSSESEGSDNITCHYSTPCPDETHTGTKLFIIEVAPKNEDIDYGPWPYKLTIEWGAK